MRPRVGLRNLVSRLKQVVLPAPFGPIKRMNAAARDAQIDAADGGKSGEFLGEILGFEDNFRTHHAAFPLALVLSNLDGCRLASKGLLFHIDRQMQIAECGPKCPQFGHFGPHGKFCSNRALPIRPI